MDSQEYNFWTNPIVVMAVPATVFFVGSILGFVGLMPHFPWNVFGGTA